MALKILSSPPPEPEEILVRIRESIEAALPGARVAVTSGGAGHFELEVTSQAFEGLSRVKQQQLVYGAITPLMSGGEPPIHAIDKMTTRLPE